ncbi:MAG: hypothetical protein RJQ08_06710 [Salinisphaeraceae bacterium]
MAETDNLILEHLRYLRTAADGLRDDLREVKTRLGHLEEQGASQSRRIDRLDERLERVERRLELVDE